MIYLLYGENSQASYMRLSQISSSVAKDQLVNLDKEHTLEDFYLSVYGDNLFSKIKVIICRNFLFLYATHADQVMSPTDAMIEMISEITMSVALPINGLRTATVFDIISTGMNICEKESIG